MKPQLNRCLYLVLGIVLTITVANGQSKPVQWSFTTEPAGKDLALIIKAEMSGGWHIYSQILEEGGPIPTTIKFESGKNYSLTGKTQEVGIANKHYDKTFLMDVVWYENSVTFTQKVTIKNPSIPIKGKIDYMVCTGDRCMPDEVEFAFDLHSTTVEKQ